MSELRRIATFASVSLAGAGIDFALGLAGLRAGLSPALALGAAMCVSATVVFFLHRAITFRSEGQSRTGARLAGFLASTLLVYAMRVALLALLIAHLPDWMALGLALTASLALNYSISRFVIFART